MTAIATSALAIAHVRRVTTFASGAVLCGAAIAAVLTGDAIAWDQVALRSVTADLPMGGMRLVFEQDVRFVLVDGAEVATSTFRRLLVAHAAAIPAAAVVAAATVATIRLRGRPARIAPEEGE